MAERLRCEGGGEWKPRNQFSKRQLEKYDQQARTGRANPAKTGIRCTAHNINQTHELQCNGPCGRVRDLHLFSKSTRRNGKNWCVDCTDWQVRTEIGEALPAPGEQLSPEEFGPGQAYPAHTQEMVFEQHVEDEDDDMSGYAVTADQDDFSDDSDESISIRTLSFNDPHSETTDSVNGGAPITGGSLSSQQTNPRLNYMPEKAPHWLIPDFDAPMPVDPRIRPAGNSSVTGSEMTESTTGPNGQPVSFNAWGPNGEFSRRTKTPTVASGTTGNTETSSRQPAKKRNSNWAKVPSRKQPPRLPDYLKYDYPFDHGSRNAD